MTDITQENLDDILVRIIGLIEIGNVKESIDAIPSNLGNIARWELASALVSDLTSKLASDPALTSTIPLARTLAIALARDLTIIRDRTSRRRGKNSIRTRIRNRTRGIRIRIRELDRTLVRDFSHDSDLVNVLVGNNVRAINLVYALDRALELINAELNVAQRITKLKHYVRVIAALISDEPRAILLVRGFSSSFARTFKRISNIQFEESDLFIIHFSSDDISQRLIDQIVNSLNEFYQLAARLGYLDVPISSDYLVEENRVSQPNFVSIRSVTHPGSVEIILVTAVVPLLGLLAVLGIGLWYSAYQREQDEDIQITKIIFGQSESKPGQQRSLPIEEVEPPELPRHLAVHAKPMVASLQNSIAEALPQSDGHIITRGADNHFIGLEQHTNS